MSEITNVTKESVDINKADSISEIIDIKSKCEKLYSLLYLQSKGMWKNIDELNLIIKEHVTDIYCQTVDFIEKY